MVVISEEHFNESETAERNSAYLKKLEQGLEQVRAGYGITKTIEELEAMAHNITFSSRAWTDYPY